MRFAAEVDGNNVSDDDAKGDSLNEAEILACYFNNGKHEICCVAGSIKRRPKIFQSRQLCNTKIFDTTSTLHIHSLVSIISVTLDLRNAK